VAVNPDGDWPLERTTSRQGRQVTHGNPRSPSIKAHWTRAVGESTISIILDNRVRVMRRTYTSDFLRLAESEAVSWASVQRVVDDLNPRPFEYPK